MKPLVVKSSPRLIVSALFSAVLTFIAIAPTSLASTCSGDASPCQLPYFKATGGDVETGGWFSTNGTLCSTETGSFYQDPNYSPSGGGATDGRYGGIVTYAKQNSGNSAGGSSSEFGAYSAGEVEGDSNNKGFYTGGALANRGSTPDNILTFANSISSITTSGAGAWGGFMVPPNGVRQTSFCVPDYYDDGIKGAAPNPISGLAGNVLTSGTSMGSATSPVYYRGTPPNSTTPMDLVGSDSGGSAVTIPAGAHVEIFVKGPVYISHNITYASGYSASQVPKFTLIVEGSIYVSKNVTNLDGFYVAQPDPSDPSPTADDTGDIWTCHDDSTEPLSYLYPTQCNQKLTVNGAFVAKQIQLVRTNGDIATATTSEDGFQAALSNGNIAETINYSPAMVIGGSLVNTSTELDNLISLPPIF